MLRKWTHRRIAFQFQCASTTYRKQSLPASTCTQRAFSRPFWLQPARLSIFTDKRNAVARTISAQSIADFKALFVMTQRRPSRLRLLLRQCAIVITIPHSERSSRAMDWPPRRSRIQAPLQQARLCAISPAIMPAMSEQKKKKMTAYFICSPHLAWSNCRGSRLTPQFGQRWSWSALINQPAGICCPQFPHLCIVAIDSASTVDGALIRGNSILAVKKGKSIDSASTLDGGSHPR